MITTRQTLPIKWAYRMLNDDPEGVVILDTETTGYHSDDEVLSVAILDLEGNVLLDQLIKPLGAIKEDAMRVNHITEAMVATAPSFLDVWPKIHDVLESKKSIVTYNAEFDERMLRQTAEQNGLKVNFYIGARMFAPVGTVFDIKAAWHCLMQHYATFWGEPGGYGRYKWQKLHMAIAQQRIEHEDWHHALGDCQAALKLLRAMAGKYVETESKEAKTE